jgi:shikimate kinase
MKTISVCHGAATIVNAIATGKGAAFGIGLETRASVELDDSGIIKAKIKGAGDEDTSLMLAAVRNVLSCFGVDYGAKVETESNIPIARGLKSSSAAANAVVLATTAAVLRMNPRLRRPDDLALINLGVDAALEAGVTITGAFDDAAASYFGGYVVTDNNKRKIMRLGRMKPYKVLLFVPEEKSYTAKVNVARTKLLEKEILAAWELALDGDILSAMKLNGILYSAVLDQDPAVALAALDAGAVSAGLCGKGPAVAALVDGSPRKVASAWKAFSGDVIVTETNNKRARVL